MDNPSWLDGIQAAISSCLPCLRHAPPNDSPTTPAGDISYDHSAQRIRRARPDELAGLLTDTDVEAETLSLHSNVGDTRRRRMKAKKRGKRITLFGWNLFGHPQIQLPDDDGDERIDSSLPRATRVRAVSSSSTVDSDAPALDPATIASLTSPQLQERVLAAEAEDRRLKEERRNRRRARKEQKNAALALKLEAGEFEGFQGSGSDLMYTLSTPPSSATAHNNSVHTAHIDGEEVDADDADLGGELYTRRTQYTGSNGSDSRSRTSASQSRASESYNHHYLTQQPQRAPHMVPLPPPPNSTTPSLSSVVPRPKKSKKRNTPKPPSSATSQSLSLPSPASSTFSAPVVLADSTPLLPDDLTTASIEDYQDTARSFPSLGLGGGGRGKARDMGVFLATRGNA
jgi:hypothetical protein